VVGRKAKHNYEKLYTEFQHGEHSSLADFAERKKISYDMLRKEFKKLGYKNGHNGEKTGQKKPDKISGRNRTKKPDKIKQPQETLPVGGYQKDEHGLTIQQKTFVMEYLLDFNAMRAAMAAGYSKKTAKAIGWELVRKPAIQREIQRQTEGDVIRLGLNRERQLLEYMRIAYANVGDYVRFGQKEVHVMGPFGPLYEKKDDDGEGGAPITKIVNYVDFEHSEVVDTSLISEVKQGKDGVSIKLHDKMKALDKLDKYLDLLPDHHRRRIEEERLKIEQERLALDKSKVLGDPDETEDDGFMDALHGKAGEAWDEYSEEAE